MKLIKTLFSILILLNTCSLHADNSGLSRLQGKTAIIVGASKGIGKSIAETFAREKANVLLVSRNEPLLKQVVATINKNGGNASYFVGDTKNKIDMDQMVQVALQRYKKIDILCFNTGIYPKALLENMSEEQWDHVIDTNLKGAFFATKAVIPSMKKQNHGKILFTSSVSGPKVALPFRAHYCASKAGLNAFMATAAVELAKYNITLNAIEPGLIMTEGVQQLGPKHIKDMTKAIPMGYIAKPNAIANAMLFLASDESSFTTGQSLVIDGGQMLPESHFELPSLLQ